MVVEHVEIMVEEPSMEACLQRLLPRLLGDRLSFQVYPSQCKQELLSNLPDRLRGYSTWLPESWRIVVVVDRDDDDCRQLKGRLERIAHDVSLVTRSSAGQGGWQVANRLAIEELEAWFFGDMDAVRAAYPGVSKTLERSAQYRDPDSIRGGTWEAFERVLQRAGYCKGGLRKVEAAKRIAPHLEPRRNRSRSFQVFRELMVSLGRHEAS